MILNIEGPSNRYNNHNNYFPKESIRILNNIKKTDDQIDLTGSERE